jgi:sialic acid synthase SpsE
LQPDESEAMRLGRSLIISRKVQKGEMITTENVKVLRTAIGIAPKCCNKVTGSFLEDFEIGTAFTLDKISKNLKFIK